MIPGPVFFALGLVVGIPAHEAGHFVAATLALPGIRGRLDRALQGH